MAINPRQTNLLVAENWKKIYQTFQEADFTSYDFETLRKTMIDYLRLYYPEDFNDFTESSEFIALIDLIAFMGQSLAFRTDLNARENFIDTAERRDSILKLARLVSYNPKRSIPASGFLKIDSVITTENLADSNGLNLSNFVVNWNDQANDNWLEQFTMIINAALIDSQIIGKPGNSKLINGILTDEYSVNLLQNTLSVFGFDAVIEGSSYPFEIVGATSANKEYIYEMQPSLTSPFNILYRNDNYGNASNNTGFFLYFKQGTLNNQDFTIDESIPNRLVNINTNNINNSDIWLYGLSSTGALGDLWESVPTVSGINVIYNQKNQRNLYQINTRAADQIDLVFGDGSFANIPTGNFRLYYRTSNGLSYKITPDEMKNISISFPYVNRENRIETLTVRASLQYTVTNATARESSAEIKQRAPQQYYTQNRMITGEDYNILPYTSFSNVIKVKSINRTSSGLSRFLDVIDSTGKYSSTNIFSEDGVLYKDSFIKSFRFSFRDNADIIRTINNEILTKIDSKEMLHFYYENYPSFPVTGYTWNLSTVGSNESTGYFVLNGVPASIGGTIITNARYIRKGSIIKFVPAPGHFFDANNNMISGVSTSVSDQSFIYTTVMGLSGDGTNNGEGNFDNGSGPITLSVKVPNGAVIDKVYAVYKNNFTGYFSEQVAKNILSLKNFGLTYRLNKQVWEIIDEENLNTGDQFSLDNQGSILSGPVDNSWLLRFNYTINGYVVYYRGIDYIFHSVKETTFYFDERTKIYDTKTASIVTDQIKLLKTNSKPDNAQPLGSDAIWNIYKSYIDIDGYVNKDRVYVTFSDSNFDGTPDNPELFATLVNPTVNRKNKFVYFQRVTGYENFETFVSVDNRLVSSNYETLAQIEFYKNLFRPGQIFYATVENRFFILNDNYILIEDSNYVSKVGRQDLAFQYRHNTAENRRIDPSSTNVTDIYILTANYEREFRSWIQDTSGLVSKPSAPTSTELGIEFSSLNNIKSISDTIVFNSAKFKLLFGNKAPTNLQATFKIIKNSSVNVSDNEIKASVINAVNTYFDISNWEFGETFYFSELSAYLHRVLSPNVSSIVIVPTDTRISFGSLYQINAEPNEIIISAATVDNVEIINAVTATQLNLSLENNSRVLL